MSIFRRGRRRPAADPGEAEQPAAAEDPEQPTAEAAARLGEDASAASGDEHPDPAEPDEPSEAELALERLEDRIGAFTSYTLAADFLELREIYQGTLERMTDEDWGRRSDRRPEGWTRRQALAHLEHATHNFNAAIEAGLADRPVVIPGLEQRSALKAANRAAIEARAETPVAELAASYMGALEHAARLAASLDREGLGRLAPVPFYGATPTVAELFGASLAHAGIIHGAQLALARSRPIWIFYQPGLMRRQINRFMHVFGLMYWPERGGDLHATLGFDIEGQGGGSWLVRVGPEGGMGKIGLARTNDVRLWFVSADLFCKVMTFQTPIWRALLLRHLRVRGKLGLARRLPELFLP